jgi:hypothetical protein
LQNEAKFRFGKGAGGKTASGTAAFRLKLFELPESVFQGAVQALFADTEVDESLRVVAEGLGGGHYGVDFGMLRIEIAGSFRVSEAEHAVFDGPEAVDAPLVIGNGVGELAFEGCLGIEAVNDFAGELLVSGEVFGGEHDDACGDAMAAGIDFGTASAFIECGIGDF